jgi:hypothetical protein
MTCTYLLQLIVLLKKLRSNNPSCTYSTPDTNFNWMEQDFMGEMWILCTPVAIILRICVSLQVKLCVIRKEHELRIDLAFNDILWKPTCKNQPFWPDRAATKCGLLLFYRV